MNAPFSLRYSGPRGPKGLAAGGEYQILASTGIDDTSALQTALDEARANNYVGVYLSAPAYLLSAPINIPSGVTMVGRGAGQYPPAAFLESANFIAQPKTRLVAMPGFPANAPMVRVASFMGDPYARHGVVISGVMLDCNAVAARGLDVVSAKNCSFDDVLIYRPTSIGLLEDCLPSAHSGTAQSGGSTNIALATSASTRDDLYNGLTITITGGTGTGQSRAISDYNGTTQVATVSTWSVAPDSTSVYEIASGTVSEGNGACQFNNFRAITVYCGSTGSVRGWVQTGNPSNNINQSLYQAIKIVHADGDGLDVVNADTNRWIGLDTFAFGTGRGCRLRGNTKNETEYARNLTMLGTQFAGPGGGLGGILVENGGGVRPSVFNAVVGYSVGNGTPLPEIEDNAQLTYYTDRFSYFSDNNEAEFFTQRTNAYVSGAGASWRHLGKLADGSEHELGKIAARTFGAGGSEQLLWDFTTWADGVESLRGSIGRGLVLGSAGGGDKGQGSANVEAAYVNGQSLGGARGSFTPQLLFAGGNIGMTGSFSGSYTLLGNKLHVHVGIVLTAKGSSTGAAVISLNDIDLDYEAFLGGVLPITMDDLDVSIGSAMISCIIPASSVTLLLYHMAGGMRVSFTHADFSDTSSISIEGVYTVNPP